MQLTCASHHFGEHAISIDIYEPIITMLKKLDFEVRKGSATKLRQRISEELFQLGWSDKTKIDSENDITITSMKGNVGLCMQTGNVSRFYADILKLQFMYIKDKVTAAIYIIPTKTASQKMGSNIAYFERFVEELNLYKHIITIPILIIGIE